MPYATDSNERQQMAVNKHHDQQRNEAVRPKCPHCGRTDFEHWSAAKRHVKFCTGTLLRSASKVKEEQRMARDKYFKGGKFLKASNVKSGQLVTIEAFEEAKTRLSPDPRPILRLQGIDQPLGLNATNYDRMVEKFSEDEKKWAGKKI